MYDEGYFGRFIIIIKESMKILIVSDTHRKNNLYLNLVRELWPLDMVIHCGDLEGAEYTVESSVTCPVHMVAGNNDFFSSAPLEDEFMIGNHRAFLSHGHHYYISMGNELIKDEARSRGADIVLYGHTHRPVIERENGLIVINPGSLTYPRQEGHAPSYALMTIDENDCIDVKIEYL